MEDIPKYIQRAARRVLFHNKVANNNAQKINTWIKKNKVDRNIPLIDLIKNKEELNHLNNGNINPGQMSIYDY